MYGVVDITETRLGVVVVVLEAGETEAAGELDQAVLGDVQGDQATQGQCPLADHGQAVPPDLQGAEVPQIFERLRVNVTDVVITEIQILKIH